MAERLECYYIRRNSFVPNSVLPVIVYRNVLPDDLNEKIAMAFLTRHEWEKRGTWGHIAIRHFHPNSHECYGSSTLLLGQGKRDDKGGVQVKVERGDVIVLPAGTAHSSIESTSDYRYIGVYPQTGPRWRNELGDTQMNVAALDKEITAVETPSADPVYGPNGPLVRLWQSRTKSRL
ncbi:hypothetical protein K461DRAFT_233579 [Myriangium duriaei CBS 260.36]|uniref:Cupin type-1 domain-containing protein n=1 Tax=Myriangium duriaei CBS 260.36 TaxID=1168546 RepID=A0A9P4MCR4_9PEZI|nr:hypothetical protein K461DRAFT_233579 [Myriangium duriaei CBS 260.36]